MDTIASIKGETGRDARRRIALLVDKNADLIDDLHVDPSLVGHSDYFTFLRATHL